MKQPNRSVLEITDCLGYVNSFERTAHVKSNCVFENKLDTAPRYTIVIPSYKRTTTLREALDSAINQATDIPYEIIITDDNPERNDPVEMLMMDYADVPNISYYKNEANLGLAGNWNRLVTLTRGKFLIMLHDDDVLAPYYIQQVDKQLAELPEDTALLQTTKTGSNNFDCSNVKSTYSRQHINQNLRHYHLGALSGGTYSKAAIVAAGGWNQDFYPSLDWFMDIHLMIKYPVYKSDTVGLFYRWEDNLSLKKETRQGFIYCDYALQNALLKRLHLPAFIRKCWLETLLVKRLSIYKLDIEDVAPLTINSYHPAIKKLGTRIADWFCYKKYECAMMP